MLKRYRHPRGQAASKARSSDQLSTNAHDQHEASGTFEIPGRIASTSGRDGWRRAAESVVFALAADGGICTVNYLRRAGVPESDKTQRGGPLRAVMQARGVIALAGVELHEAPSDNTIGVCRRQSARVEGR